MRFGGWLFKEKAYLNKYKIIDYDSSTGEPIYGFDDNDLIEFNCRVERGNTKAKIIDMSESEDAYYFFVKDEINVSLDDKIIYKNYTYGVTEVFNTSSPFGMNVTLISTIPIGNL